MVNFKKIFEDIGTPEKSLVSSHLADLSQATVADIPSFKTFWATVGIPRRRQVVSRLVELARDNVELNFDIVFKFLLLDSDADVRTIAIDGLWENEDTSFIRIFINMLHSDRSDKVKAAAAVALGRFAIMAECGDISEAYRGTLSDVFLSVINNNALPVDIRRRALESVAPLSLPGVRDAIKKAYESRDERIIVGSIFAMGRTCDETWLPVILKELNNPNAEIRYEAAGACGEIGVEECVGTLLQHVHDTDVEVQLAIIQSLGRIGGKEAKLGLQKLSAKASVAVKEAIEQALSEIETTEEMTLFEMKAPGTYDDKRN